MDNQDVSDQELLLIFRSGNIEGFNALYHRHWSALYQLARKILEDDDVAKDTVQEIFVAFYEKAADKGITQIKAYLLQSVKYQCFMHLRSGKISEKHLHRLKTVTAINSVEEYMDAEELQELLTQTIESLPERCRKVFYLSRYEFLSNKMIAEQLNISQKTVEHQITKALKTLKNSLPQLVLPFVLMLF